jgi:hypothetical protein
MPHLPLSKRLEEILAGDLSSDALTLNALLRRTGGRGLFPIIILLCLPFVAPVSIPGLSNIFGVVIAILAVRLALGIPPRLPKFIGERHIDPVRLRKVLRGSVRFLRWIEKFVRGKKSGWMTRPTVHRANALVLGAMGLLLAMPLPPLIPFSNTLPSYAIILVALSMMEEDGVLVWAGYAVAIGTVIYFVSMAGLIAGFILKHYDRAVQMLQNLL